MLRVFHDDELQAELEENGYVVVRLLSAEEAAKVASEAREIFADAVIHDSEKLDMYVSTVDPVDAMADAALPLAKRTFVTPALELLHDYKFAMGDYSNKPAGARAIECHCHSPLTSDPHSETIIAWCALVDTDAQNGAMQFIPNSHSIVPNIIGRGVIPYYKNFVEKLEKNYMVTVALKAGEAVFFYNSILHGSHLNNSNRDRPSIILGLCPQSETPAVYLGAADQTHFDIFSLPLDKGNSGVGGGGGGGIVIPDMIRYLGTIDNPNVILTHEEFDQLLTHKKKLNAHYNPLDHITRSAIKLEPNPQTVSRVRRIIRSIRAIFLIWTKAI